MFTEGGYYERVTDDGTPVQKRLGGEYIGWKESTIEQLCASESPEAAAFAKINQFTVSEDETRDSTSNNQSVTLYELSAEPDVDLTGTIQGDFRVLEEVRYNAPSESPVTGEKICTVPVPQQAITDVSLGYLPNGPYIIEKWCLAVKDAVKTLLETGLYPNYDDELNGCEKPQREAYVNSRHGVV
jgi:hypothetical protein